MAVGSAASSHRYCVSPAQGIHSDRGTAVRVENWRSAPRSSAACSSGVMETAQCLVSEVLGKVFPGSQGFSQQPLKTIKVQPANSKMPTAHPAPTTSSTATRAPVPASPGRDVWPGLQARVAEGAAATPSMRIRCNLSGRPLRVRCEALEEHVASHSLRIQEQLEGSSLHGRSLWASYKAVGEHVTVHPVKARKELERSSLHRTLLWLRYKEVEERLVIRSIKREPVEQLQESHLFHSWHRLAQHSQWQQLSPEEHELLQLEGEEQQHFPLTQGRSFGLGQPQRTSVECLDLLQQAEAHAHGEQCVGQEAGILSQAHGEQCVGQEAGILSQAHGEQCVGQEAGILSEDEPVAWATEDSEEWEDDSEELSQEEEGCSLYWDTPLLLDFCQAPHTSPQQKPDSPSSTDTEAPEDVADDLQSSSPAPAGPTHAEPTASALASAAEEEPLAPMGQEEDAKASASPDFGEQAESQDPAPHSPTACTMALLDTDDYIVTEVTGKAVVVVTQGPGQQLMEEQDAAQSTDALTATRSPAVAPQDAVSPLTGEPQGEVSTAAFITTAFQDRENMASPMSGEHQACTTALLDTDDYAVTEVVGKAVVVTQGTEQQLTEEQDTAESTDARTAARSPAAAPQDTVCLLAADSQGEASTSPLITTACQDRDNMASPMSGDHQGETSSTASSTATVSLAAGEDKGVPLLPQKPLAYSPPSPTGISPLPRAPPRWQRTYLFRLLRRAYRSTPIRAVRRAFRCTCIAGQPDE